MKNLSDIYFQIFRNTRFLTQSVSFSLAIMLLIDSTQFVNAISKAEHISLEIFDSILKNIALEIFIAILSEAVFY